MHLSAMHTEFTSTENANVLWMVSEDHAFCRLEKDTKFKWVVKEKVRLPALLQSFLLVKSGLRTLLLTDELADTRHVFSAYVYQDPVGWMPLLEVKQKDGVKIVGVKAVPIDGNKKDAIQITVTNDLGEQKQWNFTPADCSLKALKEITQPDAKESLLAKAKIAKATAATVQEWPITLIQPQWHKTLLEAYLLKKGEIQALQTAGWLTLLAKPLDTVGSSASASWIYCPVMNEAFLQAGFSHQDIVPLDDADTHRRFGDLARRFSLSLVAKELVLFNLRQLPQVAGSGFIFNGFNIPDTFSGFQQPELGKPMVQYPFDSKRHMKGEVQMNFLKKYASFFEYVDYTEFFASLEMEHSPIYGEALSVASRRELSRVLQRWHHDGLSFSVADLLALGGSAVHQRFIPADKQEMRLN